MYGPVLPDPVLLSHPWSKKGYCCKSHHRENSSHPHHCGPQLPGTLDGAAVLLRLLLISIAAMAKEILDLWLNYPDLGSSPSSLSWTCTTAMEPR